MLKKSMSYSFLAPVVVCFLFNGTPCHSMESQPEEEGTHVAVQVSNERANLTDLEKYKYYKGRAIEYSKKGNEKKKNSNLIKAEEFLPAYEIFLKQETQHKYEENKTALVGYKMSPSGDLIPPYEFDVGIGFDALWANTRARTSKLDPETTSTLLP
ncbi:MAG: hypothetical protein BGO67_06180 [Alphaproteobacteria bacterium 41-28]|nr:MAG: hypothetical protein BGO67_06180 [Alphaproteobacteria bacterium 41-28]